MEKTTLRQLRLRFLSLSVIITLILFICIQVLLYLHAKEIIEMPTVLVRVFNSISLVVAVLFITSLILRFTVSRVFNFFEQVEEKLFYSKIYQWTLYSIAGFIILYHFGVSLGNITIFIGLMATGLAFAIRDVLLSFFCWIILLRKNPFRIGDYIKIGEDEGKVLHIGTFYVLLDKTRDLPEDFIRVPNRLFLEKSIYNLGATTFHEYITFQLNAFPKEIDSLKEELFQFITDITNTQKHTEVYFDMKDQKLLLCIRYTVSFAQRKHIRSCIIEQVYTRMQEYIHTPH